MSNKKGWHYHGLMGICYGNIPVGIIVGVGVFVQVMLFFFFN